MDKRKIIIDALNKAIELEYITLNPVVSIDGVASTIESHFEKAEKDYRTEKEIADMFQVMKKYFPEKIKHFTK